MVALITGLGWPSITQAVQYRVDSATVATFEVGYVARGLVRGQLGSTTGTVDFDRTNKTGKALITFDMKVVDTGHDFINSFIRSKYIFDVENYPTMQFNADQFNYDADRLQAVVGDLTLHGVTQRVQLDAKHFVCADVLIAEVLRHQCSGEFRGTVKRSAFGMNSFSLVVKDEVNIIVLLTLELVQP